MHKTQYNAKLKMFGQIVYKVRAARDRNDPSHTEPILMNWKRQMIKVGSLLQPQSFHDALSKSCTHDPSHMAVPPPHCSAKLLQEFQDAGGDVISLADETLQGRMAASIVQIFQNHGATQPRRNQLENTWKM